MMPLSGTAATHVVAWATALVFAALALLHLYWAVRGIRAGSSALPEHDGRSVFVPGRLAALVVSVLLALAALIVLQRASLGPALVPAAFLPGAIWTLAVVMIARAIGDFRYVGFFKRVRGTTFATLDTKFFSPIVLVLGAGACWVALS